MEASTDLSDKVNALAKRVDELTSKDAIRDCIYRINRGMDRIDRDLMASGFHEDAKVRWGGPEALDLPAFIEGAIKIQHTTSRVQHLIGNILIDLNGDKANVESYEIARHLTPMGAEKKDLIIASRYIDKFSRRDGQWRIDRRDKVVDWMRVMEGKDAVFDQRPLKGKRDGQDISFEMFGAGAFHTK